MGQHFTIMRQFLAVNENVLHAFLGGAAGEAAGEARLAPGPHRPLLGAVVSVVPAQELVARRRVDPAEDMYLRDHALGGAVSALDPDLRGLALMPFTMSLEILAEAASCLLPGLTVVGLREVRAHRWLAWDDRPQTIEVTARRLASNGGPQRVAVDLRSLTEDAAGAAAGEQAHRTPAVEATVLLDEGYPDPPPRSEVALPDARASRWQPDRLYTEGMFHGPCWQGVSSIEQTGRTGSTARLRVLPADRMLRDVPDAGLVLDPVALDAAGQVIGFWTGEHLRSAFVVFPFRLAALDVFGPRLPAGTELACTAGIELIGDRLVRSDIDIVTAAGTVWARLTGWQDRRFELPSELRPLLLPPGRQSLSAAWDGPAGWLDGPGRASCRRLSIAVPADRDLWLRVWAARVLAPAERRRFETLDLPEHRRLDWLTARTAVKEAVQHLLEIEYAVRLLPADIEVTADAHGRPVVGGRWADDVPAVPVVSMSQTDRLAVALAVLPGSVRAGHGPMPRELAERIQRILSAAEGKSHAC
jgi:phosphopantetheinyl transferase (holo-ACP synthase)